MKPATITLAKIKIPQARIKRRIIVGLVVLILPLIAIGAYFYLQKTGKIEEINLALLMAKLTSELTKKEEAPLTKEIITEEEEVSTPTQVYEEKANLGEGITHLARRALKEYLETKGTDFELTSEHKIFIEDYLQKKTGNRWLELGETITFSEELILEGINQAKNLTPEQLENLKQYSVLVPGL